MADGRPSQCLDCQSQDTRWLEGCSQQAIVDYYRCSECGCVWMIAKDGPEQAPKHVTTARVRRPARPSDHARRSAACAASGF